MAKSFVDFAEAKAVASIMQIVDMLGIKLTKEGGKRGACPFCKADREFRITPENPKWNWGCFRCKKHGDTIALVAEFDRCDQTEAARRIIERFGRGSVAPASASPSSPPTDPDVAQLTALRERLMAKADDEHTEHFEAAILTEELIACLARLK